MEEHNKIIEDLYILYLIRYDKNQIQSMFHQKRIRKVIINFIIAKFG